MPLAFRSHSRISFGSVLATIRHLERVRASARRVGVLAMLAASSCGLVPEKVSLSDPRVASLLRAIEAVDRDALGFTPLPASADLRLESRPRAGYDSMLHVYGPTSRTIAFRRTASGYRWIGEQEIHFGPSTYSSVDGPLREEIVVTYETEPLSGAPRNQVYVRYIGEDARLGNRFDLTLDDVRPILAEWASRAASKR